MKIARAIRLGAFAVCLNPWILRAAAPSADEMALARGWAEENLGQSAKAWPFSFVYDGRPSTELLRSGQTRHASRVIDADRVQRTSIFTDPATGLEVRCVSIEYRDFPTVEWTVYFKNRGDKDTPILKDILGLDAWLERGPGGEFLLHHNAGSRASQADFKPLETPLRPKYQLRIAAVGGRPTSNEMSYFNVEWPGQGVIIAVGWPGQWASQFTRDESNGLRVCVGQELTHLRLHPGEEIRAPLIALQFWQGDWIRSQNIWRRWMVAHNLPRPRGRLVATHYASTYGGDRPNASVELAQIDGWVREGIKLDYWILDAGWYPTTNRWIDTGTWEPDAERFPRGLREVADRAHANGMKFVVWFEPERVAPGTWLWVNHPEWLLGCPNESRKGPGFSPSRLLNLGNVEARRWLTDHFSKMFAEQGIDVYRQDFNTEPLEFWRAADAPDRQGITENAHVIGYLAFWDDLLRRHPDLWIDTCASGGRRHDLETLRRSVPLLRSDYFKEAIGQQCHTYGISQWIPNYGSGCGLRDTYHMHSSFCPCFRIGCDMRKSDNDYALLRKTVAQFRQIEPCLMGDFYPLTAYGIDTNAWMAWQFDRPESGEGVVQAFRRGEGAEPSMRFKLHGLDPAAAYTVTDLDVDQPLHMTGRELSEQGLPLSAPNAPAAIIIRYRRESVGTP
ncbi:MAG TPA: alpha-galactosidase [Verrucomicrobiae bacterium]|nr:alpha-galactosidase [Verrucomicrobiae bacterium]